MSLGKLCHILFYFILLSCTSNLGGKIRTSNGFIVDFHELGTSSKELFSGCVINLDLSAKDVNGKILFSSTYHGLGGVSSFYYDSTILISPLNEVFSKTFVGDSFSLALKSSLFFSSFFGNNFDNTKQIDLYADSLFLNVKVLGFNTLKEQKYINSKLSLSAIKLEDKLLTQFKEDWENRFLNIFKTKGLYSVKLGSNENIAISSNVNDQFISLNYTIVDLNGRLLYTTNSKNEYYDKSLNGQLFEGFKILVNHYEQGDSVVAIIPSKLLFGERGSFVNKIPPYTPTQINLKIN